MLIGIICIMYMMKEMKSVSQRVMIIVLALMIGVGVLSSFSTMESGATAKIMSMFDSEDSMASRTNGRSELVLGGWYMFLKQPVIGVGTGSYPVEYATISVQHNLGFKMGKVWPAHAGWIKVLAENGLIGIGLMIAFVASFALYGLRSHNSSLANFGILTSAILGTAYLSTEFQSKGLLLLIGGGMTILAYGFPESRRRMSREKQESSRDDHEPEKISRPEFGKYVPNFSYSELGAMKMDKPSIRKQSGKRGRV